MFDITQFGAVGDGCGNCTEAIQKALDRRQNDGSIRGYIVFPR